MVLHHSFCVDGRTANVKATFYLQLPVSLTLTSAHCPDEIDLVSVPRFPADHLLGVRDRGTWVATGCTGFHI